MATDPAPTPLRPSAPPRNYWQLPTFALGLVAAAAAFAKFPPPPTDPYAFSGRDVSALQDLLQRRPIDPAAVAELARKVAEAADRSPADADFVHQIFERWTGSHAKVRRSPSSRLLHQLFARV